MTDPQPQGETDRRITIAPGWITGLVLAGGQGSRMGGVDKGLQRHHGVPLAQHALQRLQPQVGRCLISANRHHAEYAALGVPVWADEPGAAAEPFAGPLAGMLVGLLHCETPFLATVPCDSPCFPADLVARLAAGLVAEQAELAVAATWDAGLARRQPVFCLLSAGLLPSLRAFVQSGQRKVGLWTAQHRCATVVFDEAEAFVNANTLDDLQGLPPP